MAIGPDFHLSADSFQACKRRLAGRHFTFPGTDFGSRNITACTHRPGLTQPALRLIKTAARLFRIGPRGRQLPGDHLIVELDQHIAPGNTVPGFHPNRLQQAGHCRRHTGDPQGIYRTVEGHFLDDIFRRDGFQLDTWQVLGSGRQRKQAAQKQENAMQALDESSHVLSPRFILMDAVTNLSSWLTLKNPVRTLDTVWPIRARECEPGSIPLPAI